MSDRTLANTPNHQGDAKPAQVIVLHRCIPGPLAADPRDRQVFRRLLDLAALGCRVTLVASELLPEGRAPTSLAAAGIRLEGGPRETVPRRIARLAEKSADEPGALMITSSLYPRAHRDAALSWPGALVVDLDRLASSERRLGRTAFREAEQAGIDTEIAHMVAIEAALLERADLVVANSAATAAAVREVLGTGAATPVVVIPPTPPTRSALAARAALAAPSSLWHDPAERARIVVPARFSDEWGTPDEAAIGGIDVMRSTTGEIDEDLLIAAEDTVPRLRFGMNHRWRLAAPAQAAMAATRAELALDLRPYGAPTTSRRAELSAAGVPWVASSSAVGLADTPDTSAAARRMFGELADLFIADDPEQQARAIATLLAEPELRSEVAKVQRLQLLPETEESVRTQLGEALKRAGSSPGPEPSEGLRRTIERSLAATEYATVPRGGTLAAADPRIEALEAEMVPLRLLSRDDSINLQSTLDADARYRVYARTHLEAPPANAPPQTEASRRVRFSVLVPTYNTDPGLLEECIRSVVDQAHDNWVLCLVDDGSTEHAHHDVLRRWSDSDPRIHVQFNPWNQGIAFATNDALAMAMALEGTGEPGDHFVSLLDHDDVIKPDALAWVARYASTCRDYDIWYSDEDKILLDGRLGSPFFKPDWSPDLEMGVNYVCHLLSARADLVEEVGGFRGGFDGAQDYDLVLRLAERAAARGGRIGHIAKPLYSWRMIPGSTALTTSEKPAAHLAGHRALQESLDRCFEPAIVEDGQYDTTHRVRYSVDTSELVTILIPTRDRVDLLRNCVDRVRDTSAGVRYELLVVDNDSHDPDTLAYLDELVVEGHQVVRYPHEFSFARQVNLGALHARGDLLLILNNDTWPQNSDWLLRMMEHAQRPDVGLVGCKLMFPEGMRDDRPQHEGIVMGMAGLAYNIDLGGYMGIDQFVRNTSGVTAACVMLRPSVLLEVGGMEERLRVAYNDVDFGLRVGEWGYKVIYTPHAVLVHPESASRGDLHPSEDEQWLLQRWGPKGSVREPFISTHFEWLMPVFYRL